MFKGWGAAEKNWSGPERRHYIRVKKSFLISYYEKTNPASEHRITQIKNISLGGMCFVTVEMHAPEEKLAIDLRTPYLTDSIHIEGTVLDSREKAKGMIYETRLVFDHLSDQAELILQKIVSVLVKS